MFGVVLFVVYMFCISWLITPSQHRVTPTRLSASELPTVPVSFPVPELMQPDPDLSGYSWRQLVKIAQELRRDRGYRIKNYKNIGIEQLRAAILEARMSLATNS